MKRLVRFVCVLCLALLAPLASRAEEVIAHGRFAQVRLYRPAGKPRQFVLFLSGDQGWTASAARLARLLTQHGAMVAGVDMPAFQAKLTAGDVPTGDLENLAHYLQGYARLPTYHTPLLAAPAPSSSAGRLYRASRS